MSMLWIQGQAMRQQIHRIKKESTEWMIQNKFSIQPDSFFNDYEKKKGVTISPELRQKFKEMMVNKEFEIKPDNWHHLKNWKKSMSLRIFFIFSIGRFLFQKFPPSS